MRLDYLEIVDPDTLDRVDEVSRTALVAVAAFVGNTRLIDNIVLKPAEQTAWGRPPPAVRRSEAPRFKLRNYLGAWDRETAELRSAGQPGAAVPT